MSYFATVFYPILRLLTPLIAENQGILPTKKMYNGVILAHCKRNEPLEAEKALREMREKGLTPDVVSMTTVIDAYRRVKDYKK